MRASTKETMPVYNVLTAHTQTHTHTHTHAHTHVQMKKKKKHSALEAGYLAASGGGVNILGHDDTQHRRTAYRSGQLELRYSQDAANTANKNRYRTPLFNSDAEPCIIELQLNTSYT